MSMSDSSTVSSTEFSGILFDGISTVLEVNLSNSYC